MPPTFPEYADYDGLGLAELVAAGEVEPRTLVEACIERIEGLNPRLGAVVHRLDARARGEAAGALPPGKLRGVPFLLKDLLADLAGVPTTRGSRFFAYDLADQDSELVARWRRAGLVILGKTNTPEFGLMPTTEPALFGPARNPWDLERTTGGSSGGSAAAVAARIVPIASGGDGGGSIRIPASCCGLVGLKPSRGRTPAGPAVGENWRGMATEHVLTRSVRDSAAMLDVGAGPEIGGVHYAPPPAGLFLDEVGRPPGRLRIAIHSEPLLGTAVAPICREAVAATAELLGELGHDLVEAGPKVDREAFAEAYLTVLCAEVRSAIESGARRLRRRPRPRDFEPTTWVMGLLGRSLRASDLSQALDHLQAAGRRIAGFFGEIDVLVTPTLAAPPPRLGELLPSEGEARLLRLAGGLRAGKLLGLIGALPTLASRAFDFTPYTPLFNVSGQPALSLPLHWSAEGLPIGVQFVGRFGDEATLLRLAGQLEEARPWAGRRPALVDDFG